jgi:acyl-CoA synthetase (AMP-forming)/AMP-acid ligase II
MTEAGAAQAESDPQHPASLAAEHPDRPAVIVEPAGAVVTYAEFADRARRAAALFRERGLEPGDHIALCLPNSALFLELAWGAHYAGLLYTACSTRLKTAELAYIVADCGARAFICSAEFGDRVEAIPAVEMRFSTDGDIRGYEPLEVLLDAVDPIELDESWPAGTDMLYSSGTTGSPKGIRPTPTGKRIGDPMIIGGILQHFLDLRPGDVYLSPAPLYHAAPLRFSAAALQIGATVVVMKRFDPAAFLELVERHSVTHSQLVPTMFVRLLRLDADERDRELSSLRAVVHAAAPCPVEVKHQMIDWWGPIIHEYYSATEGAGLTWCSAEQWLAHPGTVGITILGVPHIVGEDGSELGPGETGAVYFSEGPEFEYHNDPAKTRATIDERGWATFGDIGHLDDDGFLFLTDRASYTIITGGVNVYPQEAEDALLAHAAVLDAAVFGVPDPDFGERVHAVVQPTTELADIAGLERELIEHCRSRLADVKCPRAIDFRAELPRHETGKLYKRLLVDEYAATASRRPASPGTA